MRSGKAEGVPYSLSRWTDVPAAKWAWFQQVLSAGCMEAFDPLTGIPSWWSLAPEDTLGLVFWTKDPTNLIRNREVFNGYQVKIHVTATGWSEVEKGAPDLEASKMLLKAAVEAFGAENVTWRFSPVPLLPADEVLRRFQELAGAARHAGLRSVYVAFLQENDLMPETRRLAERLSLLDRMATKVERGGFQVFLCNEDRTLDCWSKLLLGLNPPANLQPGICADPADYKSTPVSSEGCGCVLMVDPFTINESCIMSCAYCYAADKSLTSKKRSTTRGLPVVR